MFVGLRLAKPQDWFEESMKQAENRRSNDIQWYTIAATKFYTYVKIILTATHNRRKTIFGPVTYLTTLSSSCCFSCAT